MSASVCFGQAAMPPKLPMPGENSRNTTNPTLERKRTLFAQRIKDEGGALYTMATGRVIRVVNAQKRIDGAFVDSFKNSMRVALHLPVVAEQVEPSEAVALAISETKRNDTALAIVVTDDTITPDSWLHLKTAGRLSTSQDWLQTIHRMRCSRCAPQRSAGAPLVTCSVPQTRSASHALCARYTP